MVSPYLPLCSLCPLWLKKPLTHNEDKRRCALENTTSNLLFSLIVFSFFSLCEDISALKYLIWTPPIAQYPSLILSDCVLICGLIMRSYLGPLMYSRPCASSPTRCFNTPGTLQAIKGGSNRLTQVLGQYCCFCY
jgi:hypothetical protein